MNHNDRPLLERLEALAAFLPLFEQPDFKFGEWYGPPRKDPGVIMMGGYLPSDTALSFIQMAYETGWILRDFDWPSWAGSDEAIRLRDDPATQAAAIPDQLAQLLTVLIRQDRFVEGSLGGAYESGLLVAILRRAAVLADMPGGQSA